MRYSQGGKPGKVGFKHHISCSLSLGLIAPRVNKCSAFASICSSTTSLLNMGSHNGNKREALSMCRVLYISGCDPLLLEDKQCCQSLFMWQLCKQQWQKCTTELPSFEWIPRTENGEVEVKWPWHNIWNLLLQITDCSSRMHIAACKNFHTLAS